MNVITADKHGTRRLRHERDVQVPAPVLRSFAGPAAARGVSVHDLARALLVRIAEDGLVDAVLDDQP
jgi:hypothetical protein